MVKIGFCADFRNHEQLRTLAEIGAEFVELNFLMLSEASDGEIAAAAKLLRELHLPVLSYNGMLPWDLHVNGEHKDFARVDRYLARTLRRVACLGGKNVVFGSSRSRSLDGDNTRENAYAEMTEFLRDHVAPAFALAGYTCTVETLSECELVHTVEDGMELVTAAARPEIGLLIDYYHTAANGEDMHDLTRYAPHLYHTHIAALNSRAYPQASDPDDYVGIFRELNRIGYTGGVSVEAVPAKGVAFADAAREAYNTLAAARAAAESH